MGSRRKGRIIAFQALFSWEMNKHSVDEILDFKWIDKDKINKTNNDSFLFAGLITSGTIENTELIDSTIKNHLDNWDFSRISKVDLAVLRISVYSLLFQKDIPASVTIDEAIDIVKEYGNDDSYRFINGVLDAIRKTQNKVIK